MLSWQKKYLRQQAALRADEIRKEQQNRAHKQTDMTAM
jgi:hypothetical protein